MTEIFTPLDEAVAEIKRRREDSDLVAAVSDFFSNDIPWHFNENAPACYLCRHIATPNYETLRFIELARSTDLPIIIGEDPSDLLVGNNRLKRALGKMPVTKGVTRNGEEIFEHFTIIDFSSAQGEPLRSVVTVAGEPLTEFHVRLLNEIYPTGIIVADESSWIDRKGRGNIASHYQQLLSLLVVHGIMFEWYESDETAFRSTILEPAFNFVQQYFGHKPLLVELVPQPLASTRDWNAYPSVLYQYIKQTLPAE